jgi:hypothetical protein
MARCIVCGKEKQLFHQCAGPKPDIVEEDILHALVSDARENLSRWRSWHLQTWILFGLICLAIVLAPEVAWRVLKEVWNIIRP